MLHIVKLSKVNRFDRVPMMTIEFTSRNKVERFLHINEFSIYDHMINIQKKDSTIHEIVIR